MRVLRPFVFLGLAAAIAASVAAVATHLAGASAKSPLEFGHAVVVDHQRVAGEPSLSVSPTVNKLHAIACNSQRPHSAIRRPSPSSDKRAVKGTHYAWERWRFSHFHFNRDPGWSEIERHVRIVNRKEFLRHHGRDCGSARLLVLVCVVRFGAAYRVFCSFWRSRAFRPIRFCRTRPNRLPPRRHEHDRRLGHEAQPIRSRRPGNWRSTVSRWRSRTNRQRHPFPACSA